MAEAKEKSVSISKVSTLDVQTIEQVRGMRCSCVTKVSGKNIVLNSHSSTQWLKPQNGFSKMIRQLLLELKKLFLLTRILCDKYEAVYCFKCESLLTF